MEGASWPHEMYDVSQIYNLSYSMAFLPWKFYLFCLFHDFTHVIFHLLFSLSLELSLFVRTYVHTWGTLFLASQALWMNLILAKYVCVYLYVYWYKHLNKYFHDTILAMETGFLKCSGLAWLAHRNFSQETGKQNLIENKPNPALYLSEHAFKCPSVPHRKGKFIDRQKLCWWPSVQWSLAPYSARFDFLPKNNRSP